MDEHLRTLQSNISMASKAGDRALAAKLAMQYADTVLNRGESTKPAPDPESSD
jgi:uncharacterized protein YmfQ (DUF2313 family)